MHEDPSIRLIMCGHLADVQLADVLQLVGWCEHPTVITLDDGHGADLGAITLHYGYVLAATCGELSGRAAFRAMFVDHTVSFVVTRLSVLDPIPRPVGSLAALLLEALHGLTPLTYGAPNRPTDT